MSNHNILYVLITMLVLAVIPSALADVDTTSDASVAVPTTGADSTPDVNTTTDNTSIPTDTDVQTVISDTQGNIVAENEQVATDNTDSTQVTTETPAQAAQTIIVNNNQTSVPAGKTVDTSQHPRSVGVEQGNIDDEEEGDEGDETSIAEPMGPTISFQTAQSTVTVNNDAIIAGYVSNPALNDQVMHVVVSAHVPTNILIHSSDNILMGGAGLVEGTYTLQPNQNAVIDVHAIGSEVGNYVTTFNVIYWFGKDKKNFKTMNLADSFVVKEPSTTFHMDQKSGKNESQKQDNSNGIAGTGVTFTQLELVLGGGFVLLGIVIALARR